MNFKNLILIVLFTFILSSNHAQASKKCDDLIRQIAALDVAKGEGYRGFLSSKPEFNAETGQKAGDRNIMYWGQRIYVVSNNDQIISHDIIQPNFMLKGGYVVIQNPSKNSNELKLQVIEALKTNQVVWVNYNNVDPTELVVKYSQLKQEELDGLRAELSKKAELKNYDPDFVKNNFDPNKLETAYEVARAENFFVIKGWFAPRYRGVLLTSVIDPSTSNSYKTLYAAARSFQKKGFSVTFNKDFEGAIHLLSKQERLDRNLLTGERLPTDPSTNRYADTKFTAGEIEKFKQGHAFSVEVWSPEGRLIAGTVGHRAGNILSPDSIFYDKSAHKNAYDMAKIAVIALMERAKEAGLPFVDAGMVTNFTASMKGKYVPREEYEKLVNQFPKEEVKIDFVNPWIAK